MLLIIITCILILPLNISKITTIHGNNNPKERVIAYNMEKFTKDLSYLNPSDIDGRDLALCLFQGLMRINEKGEVVTGLCDSYIRQNGGLIYTFNLRDDVYYSNGETITAEKIVEFFKTLIKEEPNDIYISKLNRIINLDEYRNGKASFTSVGIKAISNKKLQFTLKSDDPNFLYTLTDPEFSIRNLDANLKDIEKNYKSILYTGPYYPNEIDEKGILLYKSDSYYGRCSVSSPKLYIGFDNITERSLVNFGLGKVDIISGDFKTDQGDFKKESVNLEKMKILIFNKKGKDLENYKLLYQYIYNKYGIKELKTSLLYDSTALNEKSSMDTLKKMEPITMIYIDGEENREYSKKILKDLKDNQKMNVTSLALTKKEFNEKINNGQYALALYDANYSSIYQELFYNNFTLNMISDKNFDTALAKKDFCECSRILNNKYFIIPICYNTREFIYGKDIEGIYYTKEGNIKLDKVKMATP